MTSEILILILGIAFIYIGAEGLVWGGVSLARRLNVTPMVIGLSVVAFGTSLPELSVSIYSVINEIPDVAVGNVIGSNIANVALILASAAVIFPITANYERMRSDILIVLLITLLFILLAGDGRISRLDGGILVITMVLYLWRLTRAPELKPEPHILAAQKPVAYQIVALIIGLVALLLGARLFTDSAVNIARHFGLSEIVIGATIVAIGTSLPELATSLVAAFRKQSGIVLGNILGSNVFNLLAVLGIIPVIHPINVPPNAIQIYMPVMFILTLAVLPMLKFQSGIRRSAGVVLLVVYLAFTIGVINIG